MSTNTPALPPLPPEITDAADKAAAAIIDVIEYGAPERDISDALREFARAVMRVRGVMQE